MNYNRANQMTSALGNSYTYDGHNRRVKVAGNGDTRYYLYSQLGQLLFSEENGVQTNYIYLGGKLIAEDSQGVTAFIHADMLGSPVARTNAAGTVQSRRHYKPFGDTYETPSYDIGYTGHKYDDDLGLSYMQARYYDPVIGRFYSNDPVETLGHLSQGNIQGFNRYAYANNNPYKYTDPDGRNPVCFTPWTAVACVGVAVAGYGIYEWTEDVEELGEAKLQELGAEGRRQQAYINCISSGGRNCSGISSSESELNEKRRELLQKAGEAAESGCVVGTSCGGPLPTTTHDNTANGLTSIFSWLFSDGDNDKEQEPPQDEKGAKK